MLQLKPQSKWILSLFDSVKSEWTDSIQSEIQNDHNFWAFLFFCCRAALRHAERLNKLERRLNIVSPVIGIGLAGYIIYIIERDYAWVFERRAINRESMELVGVDMDDADMDEADMEGDQMA